MSVIAEALGYRVKHTTDDLGGPSALVVGSVIALRTGLDPGAEAFAIAHELAHTINEEWALIGGSDATIEYQMDAAAAAVLAPRSEVARTLLPHANTWKISSIFGCLPVFWLTSRLSPWIDAVICNDFFC